MGLMASVARPLLSLHSSVVCPLSVRCLGVKDSGVTMVVNSFPAGAGGPL